MQGTQKNSTLGPGQFAQFVQQCSCPPVCHGLAGYTIGSRRRIWIASRTSLSGLSVRGRANASQNVAENVWDVTVRLTRRKLHEHSGWCEGCRGVRGATRGFDLPGPAAVNSLPPAKPRRMCSSAAGASWAESTASASSRRSALACTSRARSARKGVTRSQIRGPSICEVQLLVIVSSTHDTICGRVRASYRRCCERRHR
jgi:hypothetical protein